MVTPKYRRKVILNQYKRSIGKILTKLCKYKGVEIIEGHLMVDHVHMLVSTPPKYSVSNFMGYKKTIEEIAREVISGAWGNGEDRVNRLTNAGYNASAVQEVVNRLLNGNYTSNNLDEIVQEVIQGKWGNGQDRVNRLTNAGYNYSEVQQKVNEILG